MASKRATKIAAVLRHLAAGGDIADFPGTKYENLAVVRGAVRRGLITWDAEGNRYTLTPAGWIELTPRRFGIRSLVASTAVGAAIGAAALAFLWFPGLKWQSSAQATASPAMETPVVAAASPPADIGGRSVAPMTATVPGANPASATLPASTPTAPGEPAPTAAAPVTEPPDVQAPPVKHAAVKKHRRKPARQTARPTERSNPYGSPYANPWGSYPRYGQGSWNPYR
jgi:hypothetical protein